MDETTYLSERQVYTRIGVSRSTLRRWVKKANFPKPFKLKENGRIGFSLREIIEWENSRNRA